MLHRRSLAFIARGIPCSLFGGVILFMYHRLPAWSKHRAVLVNRASTGSLSCSLLTGPRVKRLRSFVNGEPARGNQCHGTHNLSDDRNSLFARPHSCKSERRTERTQSKRVVVIHRIPVRVSVGVESRREPDGIFLGELTPSDASV